MKRLGVRLRCARGTATIEFALISLFLFGTMMVGLDFGIYIQQRLKLGQAIEAGAIMAYNQQIGASSSDTSGVSNYITTYSGTNVTPTVAITCNGTATCGNGQCSCLDATGAIGAARTCSTPTKATCPSGGIEGNYMKIVASMTYNSVAVPDKYLGGKVITQSTVVRLQ